mgnify:CR=1 FL=1
MIKAVYKAREDGDYDFVAAFAGEHDYDEHPANTYSKEIEAEGEEVIVKDFDDLTHLVDVLEVFPKTTMPLPHRQQSGRIKL